ncbi:NAD-dependent epimerase/dehydratase family protein [Nocardia halotolerans]|uniref:NAD-dependent epimerase/dehydratase family protein n=1 Tax=Nocardia halotolerans TaxID=1755878 RepID=A0ABV8VFV0_9NOCA
MRVFITGGTGHSGSCIIPELIAAGYEVTGLARSGVAAAALSALGAKVRGGDLEDLDGARESSRGLRRRHPRREHSRGRAHCGAEVATLMRG